MSGWLLLVATGQGYSVRVLYSGWQFLPADAVASDPVGSVWNLHTQPPLWNAIVAAIAAWSPVSLTLSHAAVSLCAGGVLAAAICALLGTLGAGRRTALALTAAATLNEHVLSRAFAPLYDLPVAALLAALVWSVARLSDGGCRDSTGRLLGVTSIGTALVLTRALYHPAWWAVTLGLIVWASRRRVSRRGVAACVAVMVVPVGGWMVKNQVLFDQPSLSSWTGMNLLRSTAPAAPPGVLDRLHRTGTVSAVATLPPFSAYDGYAPSMPPCDAAGEHRVLAEPTRELREEWQGGPFGTSVAPNYNFRCYLDVYAQAGEDAVAIARAEPSVWFRARVWAVNNWFQAPPPPESNDESVLWPAVGRLTDVTLVRLPHPGAPESWSANWLWVSQRDVAVALAAANAIVVVEAIRRLRHRRPTNSGDAWSPETGAFVMAAWIVTWTSAVGIGAELGEQERFRSVTDPLTIALGGWLATRLVRTWVGARRNTHGSALDATDMA